MTAAGSEHLIIGTTKLANISVQFVANKGENKINLITFAAQNPNSHDTRACISNKLEDDSYHIHTLELFFLFCAGLNVIIKQDAGAPTAGQSFNLTCTVRLENITGPPTIGWLVPSNPISNSSSVTLENRVNDTAYESTLVFSSLHTSHGGQYNLPS